MNTMPLCLKPRGSLITLRRCLGPTPGGRAAAVDEGMPVSVISTALFGRFESWIDADYADRAPLGHEKAVWRT